METEKNRKERVRLELGVSLLKECGSCNSSGMLVNADKLKDTLLTLNGLKYCKIVLCEDISILMEKYEAVGG